MKSIYKITKTYNKKVIEEILRVKKQKGLTARNIVNVAKNKKNPLHRFFEWDNKIAGNFYRLQRAREIINDIKITVDEKEMFAFENVTFNVDDSDVKHKEYVSFEEVISNKQLRIQIIQSALKHLIYWKNKYEEYKELSPIIKSIEKVQKQLEKKNGL